jgi:hypothetical protein
MPRVREIVASRVLPGASSPQMVRDAEGILLTDLGSQRRVVGFAVGDARIERSRLPDGRVLLLAKQYEVVPNRRVA